MTVLRYDLQTEMPPQLGLVVLQSDETIERDMRRLLPCGAELLVTRIPSAETVTPEALASMEGHLAGAVSLFPRAARFSVVGYGCTSGTAQIGASRIERLVSGGCTTAAVTQPVSALVAACEAMGARRLAVVSPYLAPVSERLFDVLRDQGLDIVAFCSFDEADEARVVRIAQRSVKDAALSIAAQGGCDAVFLSCTNLRTIDVIEDIEKAVGMPCLSSNLVLAWDMLRHAGLAASDEAPGALMQRLL